MCLRIVFHADDFGLNHAVTAGIVRGFEHGLLTSAALVANAPDAVAATEAWKQLVHRHAEHALPSAALRAELDDSSAPFDLGVHLNLTQGRPLTGAKFPEDLVDPQGRFLDIVRLFVRLGRGPNVFKAAINAELAAQVEFLLDHGLRPSHLNGHQYVELLPRVADLVPDLLKRFGIHVVRVAIEPALFHTTLLDGPRPGSWLLALVKRHFARRFRASLAASVAAYPRCYFGTAHAGRIDAQLMARFLRHAPRDGLVEIALHPAMTDDQLPPEHDHHAWHDPLARLRPRELELLTSAELPQLLKTGHAKLGRLSQLAPA